MRTLRAFSTFFSVISMLCTYVHSGLFPLPGNLSPRVPRCLGWTGCHHLHGCDVHLHSGWLGSGETG